jgi:hypothetical protein
MEDYNLAMFTHFADFSKEHSNLKKMILEHFFTNLLNNLSIENFDAPTSSLLDSEGVQPC